jgi:outer membrane biogenesis lipoprotein LolB
MKKFAALALLLLFAGTVFAGQTIIQKGSVITDVFNATSLFVEKISGYQLKGSIDS